METLPVAINKREVPGPDRPVRARPAGKRRRKAKMIRPSANPWGSMGHASAPSASRWSTSELEAEIAQTSCDLNAAWALEEAARARHARENKPETEAAYEGRREETSRIRERRVRLLGELARRNGVK